MMELMCENEYCRVVSFETPSDPKPTRPCPGCGNYGNEDSPVVLAEELTFDPDTDGVMTVGEEITEGALYLRGDKTWHRG